MVLDDYDNQLSHKKDGQQLRSNRKPRNELGGRLKFDE